MMIEMSKLTKFIRKVAGNKKVFVLVVLMLIVGVFLENLIFLYIVTFIFIFLMIVDTVNWEKERKKKWVQ